AEGLRLLEGAAGPLYVDLDGTLIAGDLLWESLVAAVKRAPWVVFLIPYWVAMGRVRLKREAARRGPIDPAALPYREEILERIREARAAGRRVVLATAADRDLAAAVAGHLRLFDGVLATTAETGNLKGRRKLAAIEADAAGVPFHYLGDGRVDEPILAAAAGGALIRSTGKARAALRAMRLHQWVKNVLVFAPVAGAHRWGDREALVPAAVSFLVFGLVASGNYLLNDLMDLEADRRHPEKRRRPLASGELSIPAALGLVGLLFAAGMGLAVTATGKSFWAWIAIYVGLTNWYSLRLKQLLLVDLMALSALYTIRILAGGAATGIAVSEWLVSLSVFLFTSLAFAKRFTELRRTLDGAGQLRGRAYRAEDLDIVRVAGPVSGIAAVLVMALYLNSPGVRALYPTPELLWFVCPLLTYWILRVWFVANRGELDHDPIVFALSDRPSLWAGLGMAAAAIGASISWG
ncbi:MAG: UbiA family prenyltransferase, partial [Bryobacteraceae bacterium]|nr:UbiA family prenyltransferase [Bryobacteraceae bacterium]